MKVAQRLGPAGAPEAPLSARSYPELMLAARPIGCLGRAGAETGHYRPCVRQLGAAASPTRLTLASAALTRMTTKTPA
eukprot:scaffold58878_cov54-Phaeocystis_antarctica.AAC.4